MVESATPTEPYRPNNCGATGRFLEEVLKHSPCASNRDFAERATTTIEVNGDGYINLIIRRTRAGGGWGQGNLITYEVTLRGLEKEITVSFDPYTLGEELDFEALDQIAQFLPGLPLPRRPQ